MYWGWLVSLQRLQVSVLGVIERSQYCGMLSRRLLQVKPTKSSLWAQHLYGDVHVILVVDEKCWQVLHVLYVSVKCEIFKMTCNYWLIPSVQMSVFTSVRYILFSEPVLNTGNGYFASFDIWTVLLCQVTSLFLSFTDITLQWLIQHSSSRRRWHSPFINASDIILSLEWIFVHCKAYFVVFLCRNWFVFE